MEDESLANLGRGEREGGEGGGWEGEVSFSYGGGCDRIQKG